jgi:2-polyprenyl-3-methyl-5-hydroxy-6-metoxy-1,4-benzoquinol methylase
MTEIQICPICAGKNFTQFVACLDYTVSFEKFNLIKCTDCEFIVTSPRPSSDEIDKYYSSESYTSHIHHAKRLLDRVYILVRNFTLKWKLSLVEHKTSHSKNKRLLDYGCGTGEFLKLSRTKGWNTQGVEPSQKARQGASELIKKDLSPSLDDVPDTKLFDAITLWHVLEHVPEPSTTLQKLKSRLTHDGTLFIAVPNHRSWDGRKYIQTWAGYDVPRHFWHFSQNTMKMLLEKNDLKLEEILPMRLDAFYVSLLSEKYSANGVLTLQGILQGILNGFRSNLHARADKEYSSLIYVVKK